MHLLCNVMLDSLKQFISRKTTNFTFGRKMSFYCSLNISQTEMGCLITELQRSIIFFVHSVQNLIKIFCCKSIIKETVRAIQTTAFVSIGKKGTAK